MVKKFIVIIALFSTFLSGCIPARSLDSHENHDDVKLKSVEVEKPSLHVGVTVVGKTAEVEVVTNLIISEENYSKERRKGEGHIHMYLDGGEKIGLKNSHYTFRDLPIGEHELKVSLHNNDHTPYDVTKAIQFEIK